MIYQQRKKKWFYQIWFYQQSLQSDKGLTVEMSAVDSLFSGQITLLTLLISDWGIWKDKAICIWQYLAGIIGTLLYEIVLVLIVQSANSIFEQW